MSREFLRVLKPGGALMFQLPGVVAIDPEQEYCEAPVDGGALKRHVPGAIVRLYRRFKYRVVLGRSLARMEMFGMDRARVESLIAAAGGRLLEVRPDQSHGTPHPGFEDLGHAFLISGGMATRLTTLGPVLTPHGRLLLSPVDDGPGLPADVSPRIEAAFARGSGHGLLQLGAGEVGTALPAAFGYWRDLGARYVTAVCTLPEAGDGEELRRSRRPRSTISNHSPWRRRQ